MVALLVKVGNQTMLNFHHSLVKTAKLWSNEHVLAPWVVIYAIWIILKLA